MNQEDLEKKLDAGQQWGFRKQTNDLDYLGWILISKENSFAVEAREKFTYEELYLLHVKEAERRRKTPYHVLIVEIQRNIHESGEYEVENAYRQRDNYYFSTLDEVEKFVAELGYRFEEIKWRTELDAP